MLKLTKKADYGLIAVSHLAVNGRRRTASAKMIADRYGIPLPLLAKILQKLTRAGVLRSLAGSQGGYRLARDPRAISALEVIRSIDGPVTLTSCASVRGTCRHSSRCTVREPLRKVHASILCLLAGLSVSELCGEEAARFPILDHHETSYLS
jgi:Rrf2 family protein